MPSFATMFEGGPTIDGSVLAGLLVTGETPGGPIDHVNVTFTTVYPFVAGSTCLYHNGVRQDEGAGQDYVEGLDLQSVVFSRAPKAGDILLIDYIRTV